ncbi:MAG: right-handed parallel beta-helix repeat-containing protein [Candidatus Thorarchaeota archaeon]
MSPRQIIALCILLLLAAPPIVAINGVQLNNGSSRASIESTSLTSSYVEHSEILIRSDTDFLEQGWEGNGSLFNPFIIENLNITLYDQTCVMIYNVTAYFVIRDSYLSTAGVFADSIQIIRSENGVIDNCTITGGRYGVSISSSREIAVVNCTIYAASVGITMSFSELCIISSNTVYGTFRGIRFYDVTNGVVESNIVYRAENAGIMMSFFTEDNQIYYNSIGWNGPEGLTDRAFNAVDDGTGNVWDDSIGFGNFWWGYEEGEIYSISGIGDASDRYPTSFNDTQAPIIVNGADDLVYEVGDSSTYLINWTASDSHPYRYEIINDGIVIESEIWHLQSVSLDVGGLEEGAHNFTINFIDGSGNMQTDSLIVYVILYILGDIGTEFVWYSSILAVFVVMTAIVLMRKFR